jgi:hypothetical protein
MVPFGFDPAYSGLHHLAAGRATVGISPRLKRQSLAIRRGFSFVRLYRVA